MRNAVGQLLRAFALGGATLATNVACSLIDALSGSEVECAPGLADCNRDAADDCEANLGNDQQNCGFCANLCVYDHAIGACASGDCVLVACENGYRNDNGTPEDGCETYAGVS